MFSTRLVAITAALLAIAFELGCGESVSDSPTHPPSAAVAGRDAALEGVAAERACDEIRVRDIPERGNLVLIVSDTMRRDAAGVYGGEAKTPNFDEFARANYLFLRAATQAPWTKPAIASLFTSAYPSQHGVADDPHRRGWPDVKWNAADILSSEFETFAEVFQKKGFRTAGFVSNPWMEERFGFAQGFQVYDDSFAEFSASGDRVSSAAAAWLGTVGAHERFFLYLHYIDAHRPYGRLDAAEVLANREAIEGDERPLREDGRAVADLLRLTDGRPVSELGVRPSPTLIQMAYRRGVEDFDRALGDVLRTIDGHPLGESTAIIVTSDHGEALFTRGYGNHGYTLFEDEVAVPLVARLPGTESDDFEIACLAGLVDLLPTACDYFGISCPATVAGRSLLAPRENKRGSGGYLVSEGLPGHDKHRTVRAARYKLHFDPDGRLDGRLERDPRLLGGRPYSLYDLLADPEEADDLLDRARHPAELDPALREVFDVLSPALHGSVPAAPSFRREQAPVDREFEERLRALGYLEGAAD